MTPYLPSFSDADLDCLSLVAALHARSEQPSAITLARIITRIVDKERIRRERGEQMGHPIEAQPPDLSYMTLLQAARANQALEITRRKMGRYTRNPNVRLFCRWLNNQVAALLVARAEMVDSANQRVQ